MKTLANSFDKDEILRRLDQVSASSQRRWGRMTVHQMLCHLSDSYLVALGEKKVSPASGFLQRTVVKWAALSLPVPWPHGVATRPEIEQGRGGTSPDDFERDRMRVKELTERFCRTDRDWQWPAHAIFGPMSERDWMRWGYLHANHHLRQFGA
jgi:hypothetical protein